MVGFFLEAVTLAAGGNCHVFCMAASLYGGEAAGILIYFGCIKEVVCSFIHYEGRDVGCGGELDVLGRISRGGTTEEVFNWKDIYISILQFNSRENMLRIFNLKEAMVVDVPRI